MGQPYERTSKPLSFHKIILNNFIGGIAWGLGATVGISLVFALLGLLAKNIDFVPIIGTFISDIIAFTLTHNPANQ
ncbi:MAG TPA: DUF5665 domain-containing protein [Patescibacteria group bacterium]|nr:DUF5665 domain-containing protein [Patescibacteria group bacterium]